MDLWRKGRTRVELEARLPVDSYQIEKALDRLGYEATDIDQWGRSYRHGAESSRTAELDELEEPPGLVRLILRRGNLDETEVPQAEGELDREYATLLALCSRGMPQADEGPPYTGAETGPLTQGPDARKTPAVRT